MGYLVMPSDHEFRKFLRSVRPEQVMGERTNMAVLLAEINAAKNRGYRVPRAKRAAPRQSAASVRRRHTAERFTARQLEIAAAVLASIEREAS